MIIVNRLQKAKYLKRWRGKNGKWEYKYTRPIAGKQVKSDDPKKLGFYRYEKYLTDKYQGESIYSKATDEEINTLEALEKEYHNQKDVAVERTPAEIDEDAKIDDMKKKVKSKITKQFLDKVKSSDFHYYGLRLDENKYKENEPLPYSYDFIDPNDAREFLDYEDLKKMDKEGKVEDIDGVSTYSFWDVYEVEEVDPEELDKMVGALSGGKSMLGHRHYLTLVGGDSKSSGTDENEAVIRSGVNVLQVDLNRLRKSIIVTGMKQKHQKLADKHGVSLEQIEKELAMGDKVELEHTTDKLEAHKIAMEHIEEFADYYSKLKASGLADELEKAIKTPAQKKFDLVMHEFEVGALEDSNGNLVTDKDQALAIAYSESGMSKSRIIVKSIIVKARDYKDKLQRLIVRRQNNIASPSAEYDHKYKLQGKMSWHGLNIAIENKKGSYRTGKDPDGKPWKTYMNFDYGRIGGTKGVDNEGQDCYIGPDDTAEKVYVVHQQDPFKKCYDECKSMLNFPSKESAIEGYLSQYDRPDLLGPVSEFTIPEFKTALKEKRGTMLYRSPHTFRKSRIIVRAK